MFLENVSHIAVGSSAHIWGIDAENNSLLYRRAPLTGAYEAVESNIAVQSLDVSYDGTVVALSEAGDVYLWDETSREFVLRQTSETFDQIFIGDDTLWALDGETLYQWDSNALDFTAVELGDPFTGVVHFAVGKEDDSVFVVDGSSRFWKLNTSSEGWDLLVPADENPGIVQISAVNRGEVWALDADHGVWQLNWSNYSDGDPDGSTASFVNQRGALGLLSSDLTNLAIDDKNILYGVQTGDTVLYRDAGASSIGNTIGEQTSSAAVIRDDTGTMHLVYSTDGLVYHSYLSNGTWVEANSIFGSGAGTDISIDTDAAGNVYAAWVQGVGNDAEVWTAKGIRNANYSGYTWSAARAVSDDGVEDSDVTLQVAPMGHVTLTSHKIDALSRHDDYDIHQFSVAPESAFYRYAESPDRQDSPTEVATHDPLRPFLEQDALLGGFELDSDLVFSPLGLGLAFKSPKGVFDIRIFGRVIADTTKETDSWSVSVTGNAGVNFAKLAPEGEQDDVLPDLKLSLIADIRETQANNELVAGQGSAGARFDFAVDLLALLAESSPGAEQALNLLTGNAISLQFGLTGQFNTSGVFSWGSVPEATDPEASELGDSANPFLLGVTWVDVNGNEITSSTPASDVRAKIGFDEFIAYLFRTAFVGFDPQVVSGSNGDGSEDLGSSSFNASFQLELYPAVYLAAGFKSLDSGKEVGGFKFRAGFDFLSTESGLQKITQRDVLDIQFYKLFWRVFDSQKQFYPKDSATTPTALLAGTVDYTVGGFEAVQGDGEIVVGGSEDGSASDITDSEDFTFVLLEDGSAYGVYLQEVVGEATENGWNTVQTIDGSFNAGTGLIDWDETSITELAGSLGLNFAPKISSSVLVENDPGLVVAYGNVSSESEELQSLTDTPPGKAYVIYGSSVGAAAQIDLGSLEATPSTGVNGFAYTSSAFFYGIGTSAALVGDLDGNGSADFAFGAPDANSQAGRAYVIFAETFDQVTDIDALGGTLGFTFSGAADDEVGYAVSLAGDVIGADGAFGQDGVDDIAISAPGAEDHVGVVYVLSGANDWTQQNGVFTVADVGSVLDGQVVVGPSNVGPLAATRWGTALSGGEDLTGDTHDDLLVGSVDVGTVTVVSGENGSRIEIYYDEFNVGNRTGSGLGDVGGSVAVLPDINGDGHADMALGSSSGSAYVVFGGALFASYAENNTATIEMGNGYDVTLLFNGQDADNDGIWSTSNANGQNEFTTWQMRVRQDGAVVGTVDLQQEDGVDFDFNFDFLNEQVLINAGAGETDTANQVYGLNIGLSDPGNASRDWLLSSDAEAQTVTLATSAGPVATLDGLGNTLFETTSTRFLFDVQNIASFPEAGFEITADTALSLTVASAGDVNGDGLDDLIVGYGDSTDESGNTVQTGTSYILLGGTDLTTETGPLALDSLTAEQGYAIPVAGGVVSAAGNVNGDDFDDLLVSDPGDSGTSDQGGASYIIYGSSDGSADIGLTLVDSVERERSGTSLTPLGDLDGDGLDDFLIGAPQSVSQDQYTDAAAVAEMTYVTRSLSNDDGWSADSLLQNEGAENNPSPGDAPSALALTSLGTLLVWIDAITDGNGNKTGERLYGSFFNSGAWSGDGTASGATSQLIYETSNVISDVSIADLVPPQSGQGLLWPTVVWVETNPAQSNSTTVKQTLFDIETQTPTWQTPSIVEPTISDIPSFAPTELSETLVTGVETLSVEDVYVTEADTKAAFVVKRTGDLSHWSGDYSFRLKDAHAVHGLDYKGKHTGTFKFKPGEDTHKIHVRILDDTDYEGVREDLRLEITTADREAHLRSNGLALDREPVLTATMSIGDEDSTPLKLSSIDSGFQINGETGIGLGSTLSPAGDLNGDTFEDFMVAAPYAGDASLGEVYLIYGAQGIEVTDFELSAIDGTNGHVLMGNGPESLFPGEALAFGAQGATPLIAIGAPGVAGAATPGHVFVKQGDFASTMAEIALTGTDFLEITAGVDGNRFGKAIAFGAFGADTNTSLVVASNDAILILKDITGQGATGSLTLSDFSDAITITDSEADGIDGALAVMDFNDDGYDDLVIGNTLGNPLVDEYGLERGFGGYVAVILGTASGITAPNNTIDLSDLGTSGFRLLGVTEFTPEASSPSGDPTDGSTTQSGARPGTAIVDGAGAAVAVLDFNGDGSKDLAIGAPEASLPNLEGGMYSDQREQAGRAYLLFGGAGEAANWSSGDHQLADLYTSRAAEGIILEGTQKAGRLGASLSNIGFFRGSNDEAFNENIGIEDLAIGAPGVEGGAGQAYAAFGSFINFSGLGQGSNVFEVEPGADPGVAGALPTFTFKGLSQEVDPTSLAVPGALGTAVSGIGNVNGSDLATTGGTDLALGAPATDLDGVGKSYVATGHPWIQPGDSLAVKDLRSDNGVIMPVAGSVQPLGDFNSDGYDDYLVYRLEQNDFAVVYGASLYDTDTSDRVAFLSPQLGDFSSFDGVFRDLLIAVGDFDGDGISDTSGIVTVDGDNNIYVWSGQTGDFETDPQGRLRSTYFTEVLSEPPTPLGALFSGAGDFNGDGYDDIYYGWGRSDLEPPYLEMSVVFSAGDAGFEEEAFEGFTPLPLADPVDVGGGLSRYNWEPFGTVDIDGDGKDEILVQTTLTNEDQFPQYLGPIALVSHDASGELTYSLLDLEFPGAGSPGQPGSVFYQGLGTGSLPTGAGDVNGDGVEDLLLTIFGLDASDNPVEATYVLYGSTQGDYSLSLLYQRGDGESPEQAAILGDMNQDGFDDILVSQASADGPAWVVYGRADLPEIMDGIIELPATADAAFDYGFAIEVLPDPNSDGFDVGSVGDANGDGRADFLMSDLSPLNITYTVFGEVRDPAEGVTYIDGTRDDDVLIQPKPSDDPNSVFSINGNEGDDYIQTRNAVGTEAFVYGAAGDDIIGLSSVDSSNIGQVDGGSGFDTILINTDAIGQRNTLDLRELPGKVHGIEQIDLGLNNAVSFDLKTFRDATGTANTLIINGNDSAAKPYIGANALGEWSPNPIGEQTFDGKIYEVYGFTLTDGTETNDAVWLERGGVAWSPNISALGAEGGPVRGTVHDDTFVELGGPCTKLNLRDGGADIIDFVDATENETHDKLRVHGFGEDDRIDIGEAMVLKEHQCRGNTILILDSNRDKIVLCGVTDFDAKTQLIQADDGLI
ncbi:MAG: Calx-beta domain-containing protein [Pseudomonadota bacterium]